MLEALTCGQGGSSELSRILLVPEQQRRGLQVYSDAMCGSKDKGQRSERFRRMSVVLKDHINMRTAAEKVTPKLSTECTEPSSTCIKVLLTCPLSSGEPKKA